jgi:uncharacterized membrane protein
MRRIRLNLQTANGGYVISVAIALLIASILLGYYFIALRPVDEGYMSISLLDSQKKATNYPEFLVNGINTTFSVYVEVENHMEKTLNAQILVKVTENASDSVPIYSVSPIAVYNMTMETKLTWEEIATVSLDEPGNYLVFFELWISDQNTDIFEFSNNYCVLSIQVV